MNKLDTIVFDLGGVLIDWNPRYLYRKIFQREEDITWFLENICTSDWNDEQDAGRSFEDATRFLVEKYPDHKEAIEAWYSRWTETIRGPVEGSVRLLEQIKEQKQFRLYALTNWSAQTFPWALDNFHFLQWFEGVVVSGVEQCRKPFPEIYQILFNRFAIQPEKTVFIDDNIKNIETGRRLGLTTIHFESPDQIETELRRLNVLK